MLLKQESFSQNTLDLIFTYFQKNIFIINICIRKLYAGHIFLTIIINKLKIYDKIMTKCNLQTMKKKEKRNK